MGSEVAAQRRIGVDGTTSFARAAAAAGVERFIHVSTAAVYDRSPGVGDADESSALVGDDAGDYPVTKRDADRAIASLDGLTRVLLRLPAILGTGESSIWNAVRPAMIRDDEAARHAVPEQSFAWVHVDGLVAFAADIATARVAASTDPATGPVTRLPAGRTLRGRRRSAVGRRHDVVGGQRRRSRRSVQLAPVTVDLGLLAGRLRAKHYHRDRMAVSVADCIAAATALTNNRPLATSDPALAGVVRAEGGTIHGLPDSRGISP